MIFSCFPELLQQPLQPAPEDVQPPQGRGTATGNGIIDDNMCLWSTTSFVLLCSHGPPVVCLSPTQLHRFSPESNKNGGSVYSKPESYYDVYASNGYISGGGGSKSSNGIGAGQSVVSPPSTVQKPVETYTRATPPMPYKSGGNPAMIDFSSTSPVRRDNDRDRGGESRSAATAAATAIVAPQTEWSV